MYQYSKGRGAHRPIDMIETPSTRTSTNVRKLPNREPDAAERRYLRRLYEELGSKNKVLWQVWGGVVNESGKTPKTKRWLDEALLEVVT